MPRNNMPESKLVKLQDRIKQISSKAEHYAQVEKDVSVLLEFRKALDDPSLTANLGFCLGEDSDAPCLFYLSQATRDSLMKDFATALDSRIEQLLSSADIEVS